MLKLMRHNCDTANDKTLADIGLADYSYAKQLGLSGGDVFLVK